MHKMSEMTLPNIKKRKEYCVSNTMKLHISGIVFLAQSFFRFPLLRLNCFKDYIKHFFKADKFIKCLL